MTDELRRQRKIDHIENYLKSYKKGNNLLSDVFIEHQSLPEIDFNEIDTSVEFLGKKIEFPLMINAMTGGSDICIDINTDLSNICYEFGFPMATGSEVIALKDEESLDSFEIVKNQSKGEFQVIGNMPANSSIEEMKKAEMILNADAMQLHLNPAQELIMSEGERNFIGYLQNIENLLKNFDKPIIVKEVGFGMSKDTIKKLLDIGVEYIDISGKGGTNFVEIEDMRNYESDFSSLYEWGIPTAKSIIDARKISNNFYLIASGGLSSGVELAKSIIIGADMTAMSGEILSFLLRGGYDYTKNFLDNLIYEFKVVMALLGVKNIEELKKVPYKVTGKLKELID
ncbi:MAG: type 2 isopentenyl-diphosphate Delta-isomerase [Peptoniphilaceae bacterium]|nr:type 2 isopentenyl-diphosphate Delta-isomerase [Peptoniphilaceae bacterium]MDD7382972.1 type 2 isopentenyl-diphosphate Delta-isomerase [Peptoniphilaceae bacterium]MDY3737723.1 type 2 isopentenyl-diphosphate Delta-isomerase [Peptoniphilaceae bacterium]